MLQQTGEGRRETGDARNPHAPGSSAILPPSPVSGSSSAAPPSPVSGPPSAAPPSPVPCLPSASDECLLAGVRQRDAEAFEALFARYRERIRVHLMGIMHDAAGAEDLVQETFLRVWTRAEQWDGRGLFRAWLFRIASNLALNHLRTLRRRRERPLEVPPEASTDGDDTPVPAWMVDVSTPGPDAALEQAERVKRCRRILGELPEEKRVVFRLVQEEEMELRDVAEALGIPEGTVKSRLHYARKRLAAAWLELEAEEEGF